MELSGDVEMIEESVVGGSQQLMMTTCPHKENQENPHCSGSIEHPSKGKATLGVIIRNERGSIIEGNTKEIPAVSSRFTEAAAVREACLMTHTLNLNNAVIEGDNTEVILFSANEDDPSWEIATLLEDIRNCAKNLNFQFSHTPRANNKAGDWIAKACMSKSLPPNWKLKAILLFDCNYDFNI
ncbi:unnamed protein product [Ilex paraguariensis]|uniref:RNase H type-1 domain-containing protein n=1 Tax=Ilex paraguariensis TaxID=185542 RepID=A0ABC8REN3_9AQUA